MNKIFPVVIIFLVLSCQNDPEADEISYPVTYISHDIVDKSFNVYTADGEITDESIISALRNSYTNNFFNDLNDLDLEGHMTVKYTSSDTLEYQTLDMDEPELKLVTQGENITYWESQDTIVVFGHVSEYNKFFKHLPLYYSELYLADVANFSNPVTKMTSCEFASHQEDGVYYPIVDYFRITDFFHEGRTGVNNVLKEIDDLELELGDTLIVKQYYLRLFE